MDWPLFLLLPLVGVALGASLLGKKDPTLRPVAWLLWSGVVTDLVQRSARAVYSGTRALGEHYDGVSRLLFHVGQVAHVSWPLGVMAVGWWQFMPTRWRAPWPVGVIGVLTGFQLVTSYLACDPDQPSPVFFRVEALVLVVTVGILLVWPFSGRRRHTTDSFAVALLLFESAILAGPYDIFGFHDTVRVIHDWDLALLLRVVLYTTLAALEVTVWRAREP